MHSAGEFVADTADHITENEAAAIGVDPNPNHVFVSNFQFSSIGGGQRDVALCNDDAFGQFHFTFRTNQLAVSRAGDITGFPDRSSNADGAGISSAQFNLAGAAFRASISFIIARFGGKVKIWEKAWGFC